MAFLEKIETGSADFSGGIFFFHWPIKISSAQPLLLALQLHCTLSHCFFTDFMCQSQADSPFQTYLLRSYVQLFRAAALWGQNSLLVRLPLDPPNENHR